MKWLDKFKVLDRYIEVYLGPNPTSEEKFKLQIKHLRRWGDVVGRGPRWDRYLRAWRIRRINDWKLRKFLNSIEIWVESSVSLTEDGVVTKRGQPKFTIRYRTQR